MRAKLFSWDLWDSQINIGGFNFSVGWLEFYYFKFLSFLYLNFNIFLSIFFNFKFLLFYAI